MTEHTNNKKTQVSDQTAVLSVDDQEKIQSFLSRYQTNFLIILFTDLADSTGIKEEIGDVRAKRLEDLHRTILLHALKKFENAQAVRAEGDSYIIVFLKPGDAIIFALRVQAIHREARTGNVEDLSEDMFRLPDIPPLSNDLSRLPEFRVGIHMGTIIEEDGLGGPGIPGKIGDIKGIQADTTARIMGLAQGGQILCSLPVFDDARHALRGCKLEGLGDLGWEQHGLYRIKGREHPLGICEVGEKRAAPFKKPAGNQKAEPVFFGDDVSGWHPAMDKALPGTNWIMKEKLGESRFGQVWLAHHRTLESSSVFKFCVHKSKIRHLNAEVNAFKRLTEKTGTTPPPGILGITETSHEKPPYYIQSEYMAGGDMKQWLERKGQDISPEIQRNIGKQMAEALARLHKAGLTYPDIRLSDFLIQPPESPDHAPVLKLKRVGSAESCGNTSEDISALGIILYQLFSRRADNVTDIDLLLVTDPILRKDIRACLRRDTEKRPSARDVVRGLQGYEKRRDKKSKIIRGSAFFTIFIVFFLLWIRIFDFLTLDTRLESVTMMLGDMFKKTSFNEQIAIVAIEDEGFDKTWRKNHAVLIKKLSRAGAKVIAFDLFFEETTVFDDALTESIQQARKQGTEIIVGIRDVEGDAPKITDGLRQAVSGFGMLCMGEKLGYAVKAPLVLIRENLPPIPSLPLSAVLSYLGSKILHIDAERLRMSESMNMPDFREIRFSEQSEADRSQKGCLIIQKEDKLLNQLIDISPSDVLRDPVRRFVYTEIITRTGEHELKKQFNGKIVLVGVQNRRDIFDVFRSFQREDRYGMELQADVINTLLNRVCIHFSGPWGQLAFIALFGILGTFIRFKFSHILLRKIMIVSALILCFAVVIYCYREYQLLLNPLYYVAALFFSYQAADKIFSI
ncbi:CHASE2 domain-containing protein [Desulfonema magnum]|uniref:Kinase domain-containing protein n=1 Tax=Desulfonema magnum TaxID=45655 RepID=A0A975BFV5_9BACT|nr:CHASE2 domain-containing protein [Desulfonema magnum]QTA84742.1 Kinase domain-containing protein [Desulfonema magnum]